MFEVFSKPRDDWIEPMSSVSACTLLYYLPSPVIFLQRFCNLKKIFPISIWNLYWEVFLTCAIVLQKRHNKEWIDTSFRVLFSLLFHFSVFFHCLKDFRIPCSLLANYNTVVMSFYRRSLLVHCIHFLSSNISTSARKWWFNHLSIEYSLTLIKLPKPCVPVLDMDDLYIQWWHKKQVSEWSCFLYITLYLYYFKRNCRKLKLLTRSICPQLDLR